MADIAEESKVKYNFLGKSGLRVSNVCLGTMTFGESTRKYPGQSNEELAHKIMDRYTQWGGNFLDTADLYGGFNSEKMIGTWLEKQTRENFVVATKCRINTGRNVNAVGLSRRHITKSVEDSLERLRTDYVDLYYCPLEVKKTPVVRDDLSENIYPGTHCFDNATPLEETYRTLDDLVRCGKIRYVGVSNVSGWQLQKIVDTQKHLGLNPVVCLQQQYSLAHRESELEPFQVCKNEGIGVLPWSPLKGGLLTGKTKRGQKPTEGRMAWVAEDGKRQLPTHPLWTDVPDKVWDTIDVAETIAQKIGRSTAQVAIRWTMQRDVTTSVIIGARTLDQLDQNMAVNGWSLTAEEMKQLDDVSSPSATYPYEMIDMLNKDRVNTSTYDFHVKPVHPQRTCWTYVGHMLDTCWTLFDTSLSGF